MAGIERVASESVEIEFESRRCIHSRHCVLDRPDVFVPNVKGGWIHPERATADEVAELAHNCPSGAIRYRRLDGGAPEQAPPVNVVTIRENGPLAFHAELLIAGTADGFRATLCRCGASRHKPYCDGQHTRAAFVATGEPATKASADLSQRNGVLNIRAMRDGPLAIEGNLELVSGTGRTVNRTAHTELCRCGQSANKPYCDGSHERVGFKADGMTE